MIEYEVILAVKKRLSLGLDVSTQGISAVLLDIDSRDIIYRHSLDYKKDPRLNKYNIEEGNYLLPPKNTGDANQPPKMFFSALESILAFIPVMEDSFLCS